MPPTSRARALWCDRLLNGPQNRYSAIGSTSISPQIPYGYSHWAPSARCTRCSGRPNRGTCARTPALDRVPGLHHRRETAHSAEGARHPATMTFASAISTSTVSQCYSLQPAVQLVVVEQRDGVQFQRDFSTDREQQRSYERAIPSEDRVSLSVGNRVLGAHP